MQTGRINYMNIELVIFDMDALLIDSESVYIRNAKKS